MIAKIASANRSLNLRKIAYFSTVAFLLLVLCSCNNSKARLEIENETDVEIVRVDIDAGQHQSFQTRIRGMETGSIIYRIKGDCDLKANITYADGRYITWTGGYISTGMRTLHKIKIDKNRVQLVEETMDGV